MQSITTRLLASLLIAVALNFGVATARADPSLAWQAFTNGNHDKAEAIWRPLAEQGDYNAAFGLGMLAQTHNQFKEAAHWYEQAARAGLTSAQVLLSSMYIDGRGIPRDMVHAYAWLNRATLDGHANAALALDAIAATLTPEQLTLANALSDSFATTK